jgi:hypothetical protein
MRDLTALAKDQTIRERYSGSHLSYGAVDTSDCGFRPQASNVISVTRLDEARVALSSDRLTVSLFGFEPGAS